MDALTHRLAAALGSLIDTAPGGKMASTIAHRAATAQALIVHAEYAQRCKEQAGLDHYHGREGG